MAEWHDSEDDVDDWSDEFPDPVGELETRVDGLDCDVDELADRVSVTQGVMWILFFALAAAVAILALSI